jgi:hypothetical protein
VCDNADIFFPLNSTIERRRRNAQESRREEAEEEAQAAPVARGGYLCQTLELSRAPTAGAGKNKS